MSGVRDALLPMVDAVRSIQGPNFFGTVVAQLTIRTRTYTSGHRSSTDTFVDSDLVLPKYYEVINVSSEEVLASGGKYATDSYIVGPITPSNGRGVGYTRAQIFPSTTSDGVDFIYILSGDVSGEFFGEEQPRAAKIVDPFGYYVLLTRRETTP